MGSCYDDCVLGENEVIISKTVEEKTKEFKIENNGEFIPKNPVIKLKIFHADSIESTMPSSREVIDKGNKMPFLYNTDIQTAGRGKGSRKWAGSIKGNVYTTSCIPFNLIPDELIEKKTIFTKIASISIYETLDKYAHGEFCLKYPNDILCKDGEKLGGILVEVYKGFINIGFGLNIVDKPEQNEIRQGGNQPCFVKKHLKSKNVPNALDISVEITERIFYNLNLTDKRISELYDQFSIQMSSGI